MKYLVLGGAGFLGKNLCIKLLKDENASVVSYDRNYVQLTNFENVNTINFKSIQGNFETIENCDKLVEGFDVIFHLISSTVPGSKNNNIQLEMESNILPSLKILDSCIKYKCKLIFISSGGTVYGKTGEKSINENFPTNPICHYGIQKLIIEKYILLYKQLYDLDCRIIRLSNPYGPYQSPNSGQGAITTFVYNAINNIEINILGDGNIVRDYIYVDDAIQGIINISNDKGEFVLFNLGSGNGKSLIQIIQIIEKILQKNCKVNYLEKRNVDVPYNVLNVDRYKKVCKVYDMIDLKEGIEKLVKYFLKNEVN